MKKVEMNRREIGSKVVIKNGIYKGKKAIITQAYPFPDDEDNITRFEYALDIDDETGLWSEEMFEEENSLHNDTIYFAKVNNNAIIPTKREEDGAFDIYACFEEDFIVIMPHETKMIPTGLASAFLQDYVAILKERGSTGSKGIGQRCGVIDSGYRGEWFVPVTNHNNIPFVIAKPNYSELELNHVLTGFADIKKEHILYLYEKAITQCIMVEVPKLKIKEISHDEIMKFNSERGVGCLGSSSK